MMWTVLLLLCTILSLNGCGDANNVSGPPGPAIPEPLSILTSSPLPAGATGVPYNITLAPGGGTPPYTWNLVPGSPALPNGLTLNPSTGNIAGAATATGTTPTVFTLQDSKGESVQKSLPITVTITPGPLTILTPSLPSGVLNQPYNGAALSATGGRSPYTWDIVSGALPGGLSLDQSGIIRGTPQGQGGTSSATFRVRDSGNPQETATKPLSITITVPAPPTISGPPLLPAGTVNQPYPNTTLTVSGGTAPLTWDPAVSPALPNGLSWDAATQTISGTPLIGSQGTMSHTFTVRDSLSQSGTKTYSLTISLPALPSITTTSLPNAIVGVPYSLQLQATGGFGAITWSITLGSLPVGLGMDGAGLISGALNKSGPPVDFTVQVIDQAQRTATQNFTLTLENNNNPNVHKSLKPLIDSIPASRLSTHGSPPVYGISE